MFEFWFYVKYKSTIFFTIKKELRSYFYMLLLCYFYFYYVVIMHSTYCAQQDVPLDVLVHVIVTFGLIITECPRTDCNFIS